IVVLNVVPGEAGEPVLADVTADVGGEHKAIPVDDRVDGYGSAEAIRVADHPAGEHAAAGAARDEQLVRVDVALGQDRIDTGIQIGKVVARISVVDQVPELRTVTGAAARVGIE